MDRGMVEFYWSLGAEIKIQSILRGAVPVCSSDRGPRSQLMEVRTVVFTHESQLHPWPLSMFLSVQGDTVNCCDRLPIDDIIELDIRLGENDCIYIYIHHVSHPSVRYTSWQKCWHAFILTYTRTCSPTDVLSWNSIYYIIILYVFLTITLTFFLTHILTFILTDFLMYCCCVCFLPCTTLQICRIHKRSSK